MSTGLNATPTATRGLRLSRGELTQPYDGSCGIGKWDRFMTPGRKVQGDDEFDFNRQTFRQLVRNFERVYSLRRLPLDFRHAATMESAQEAEQNLAYYNGVCSVWDGKVDAFWSQDPIAPPPDPTQLLAELREKFPRADSVDGLWGYKSEVTPLGMEKLPNMEQLSPLFSKQDVDEANEPIGYSLLNVSAVGVAFQNGTLINLGKRINKMAQQLPDSIMAKLKKHGFNDEMGPDGMARAFAAYMSDTDEGPTERKEMAQSMATLFPEHAGMSKGKMGGIEDDNPKNPVVEFDKGKEEESSSDKAAQMNKKLRQNADQDPAVQKLLDSLTKGHSAMAKELEGFRKKERERADAEYHKTAAAHVSKEDAAEYLALSNGDTEKALRLVQKHPRRDVYGRITQAGAPLGVDPTPAAHEAAPVVSGRIVLHGFALAKEASQKAADSKGVATFEALAAAQRQVARSRPDLMK